jgi:transcriptional regulator GlxA family with amidase domain
MQHITIVALPTCLTSSISLPLEILNAANEAARSHNRNESRLDLHIASQQTGLITTASGLNIVASTAIQDITNTDLIILPSLWRNPLPTLKKHSYLLAWLQKMSAQGATICAVGTSSYFLAEAALLDHKPATTHWRYCNQFAKRYPKVDLKPQYLITQAENIFCVGSINSIADLMIHLVARLYGQRISRLVESQFSPEIRRPFEDHTYSSSDTHLHQDEIIIEAQDWLQQHFNEEIKISNLANSLDLSIRSFNRRFKQATGVTASQYLLTQRLENARDLLRTSNLSIQEVAEKSGYQNSSYFCLRFKDEMRQTPLNYRKASRGKLFKTL